MLEQTWINHDLKSTKVSCQWKSRTYVIYRLAALLHLLQFPSSPEQWKIPLTFGGKGGGTLAFIVEL